MVSRIDSVIGERTERRRATAVARVDPLLRDLRLDDFDIMVIGSLARREFRSHSDVDFLVRGSLDSQGRTKVERAVAAAMRGSGISYDLIYATDLTPERLKEFVEVGLQVLRADAVVGAAQPGLQVGEHQMSYRRRS